jgi:hypothetical protein
MVPSSDDDGISRPIGDEDSGAKEAGLKVGLIKRDRVFDGRAHLDHFLA